MLIIYSTSIWSNAKQDSYDRYKCLSNLDKDVFWVSLGCQLDEPYSFPGDHQQNAAMLQCHVHPFLCHCCILSDIKLLTTNQKVFNIVVKLILLKWFLVLQKTPQTSPARVIQSGGIIIQSNIMWYCITAATVAEYKSEFKPTKDPPYLTVTGELYGAFCKEFWENWRCYDGTTLYIGCLCRVLDKIHILPL